MKISTIALVATFATAPLAANAITLDAGCPGGINTYLGQVEEAAFSGAGTADFTFDTCSDPAKAIHLASLTPTTLGSFQDLTVGWYQADGTTLINEIDPLVSPGNNALATVFSSAGNGLTQILRFSWSQVAPPKGNNSASFDFEVSTVPVPAGILLLGTALAGLGLVRRKA